MYAIRSYYVGVGGMGGYHLNDMVQRRQQGQVNIAAVCDIDKNRLINALKTAVWAAWGSTGVSA